MIRNPARAGDMAQEVDLDALHRFHPYCARFPSTIAEDAIRTFTQRGESIYDPFCGSGTTLVAGLLQKRRVVGGDIDVLAGMLSELKCFPKPAERYRQWRRRFGNDLEDLFDALTRTWPPKVEPTPGEVWVVGKNKLTIPNFAEMRYWFPPRVIALLAAISELAQQCKDDHYELLALVSLSAAIVAKWPNTISYAKDIDHTRPHRELQRLPGRKPLTTFLKRLDRSIDCLGAVHRLYDDAGVLSKLTGLVSLRFPHDARVAPGLKPGSQTLILTSPPYFNAVDYPRAHRMSVCWTNGRAPADPSSRHAYLGLRPLKDFDASTWLRCYPEIRSFIPINLRNEIEGRRLVTFFADLQLWLFEMWKVLTPGGHLVCVIADNWVGDRLIRSHMALLSMAKQVGFTEVSSTRRTIRKARRRFPVGAFGFNGPMTHEHVVVVRKPRGKKLSAEPRVEWVGADQI